MRKTQKFEVLYPISPEQGAILLPAKVTDDNPNPAPTLCGIEIFGTDDMTDVERRAGILIAQGHLKLYEPAKADTADADDKPTTTKDTAKE